MSEEYNRFCSGIYHNPNRLMVTIEPADGAYSAYFAIKSERAETYQWMCRTNPWGKTPDEAATAAGIVLEIISERMSGQRKLPLKGRELPVSNRKLDRQLIDELVGCLRREGVASLNHLPPAA